MFTVKLSMFARSGSYAASALRSVSGRAGAAGGINSMSGVMRAAWLAGISLSHSISSRYCVLRRSLLLIYIVVQVFKKFKHTKFFVSPNLFSTQKNIHAQLLSNVHTQTPEHSTGLSINGMFTVFTLLWYGSIVCSLEGSQGPLY